MNFFDDIGKEFERAANSIENEVKQITEATKTETARLTQEAERQVAQAERIALAEIGLTNNQFNEYNRHKHAREMKWSRPDFRQKVSTEAQHFFNRNQKEAREDIHR